MGNVEKKISELWGKQIKKECPELTNLEGILNHLSLRNRLKNMFAKTKAGDLMGNVSLVDGHIDEPKMTDEKIIKAFEVCYIDRDEDCSECPFCNEDMDCTYIEDNNLLKDVFDLINRKDAEIERLTLEVEAVNELINPLPFKSNFDRAMETAKAEEIKEFAFDLTEEVKEINTSNRSEDKDDIIIHVLDIIDNLKKCPKLRPDERY